MIRLTLKPRNVKQFKEFGLTKSEWLRRLTPIELERLNTFLITIQKAQLMARAFFMGNTSC